MHSPLGRDLVAHVTRTRPPTATVVYNLERVHLVVWAPWDAADGLITMYLCLASKPSPHCPLNPAYFLPLRCWDVWIADEDGALDPQPIAQILWDGLSRYHSATPDAVPHLVITRLTYRPQEAER